VTPNARSSPGAATYDALLLVSFGGPEGPDEVLPFLRRVTAGRGVPDERLARVAAHYDLFGGVSPINDQNRQLLAAIRPLVNIPVYWGNRNAAPFIAGAVAQMTDDGIRRGLAFVTSAYGSFSGCRQYRDDLAAAQAAVGSNAPGLDKIRAFYNHPLFIEPFVSATQAALSTLPPDLAKDARLVFTAHSIPTAAAAKAPYVAQLRETARLVADAVGGNRAWELCWQSRSGPPQVAWLEPDIGAVLEGAATGDRGRAVVVVPIGFVSDHVEVIYDLDIVAIPAARNLGLTVVRATTPGVALAPLVAELVAERQNASAQTGCATRTFVGTRGPAHDFCPTTCCAGPPTPR
jgi:ferrochelatase